MRMREDENVAKYVERIKASISAIKSSRGDIKETTIVSKVLRTHVLVYVIRVSSIQEKRCDPNNKIGLNDLIGRLTTLTTMFLLPRILSLHLKINCYLKKRA